MQTYGVLKELMTFHVHTYGLVMGGSNRSAEAQRLVNGVNILIATPGRLLDHLQVSQGGRSRHGSVHIQSTLSELVLDQVVHDPMASSHYTFVYTVTLDTEAVSTTAH